MSVRSALSTNTPAVRALALAWACPGVGLDWQAVRGILQYLSPSLDVHAASLAVAEAQQLAPDPASLLDRLATLICFRDGMPMLDFPVGQVATRRLFDLDALTLAALIRLGASPNIPLRALDWDSTHTLVDRAVEPLFRNRITDNHLHLGGAVPLRLMWIGLVSGAWDISRADIPEGSPSSSGYFDQFLLGAQSRSTGPCWGDRIGHASNFLISAAKNACHVHTTPFLVGDEAVAEALSRLRVGGSAELLLSVPGGESDGRLVVPTLTDWLLAERVVLLHALHSARRGNCGSSLVGGRRESEEGATDSATTQPGGEHPCAGPAGRPHTKWDVFDYLRCRAHFLVEFGMQVGPRGLTRFRDALEKDRSVWPGGSLWLPFEAIRMEAAVAEALRGWAKDRPAAGHPPSNSPQLDLEIRVSLPARQPAASIRAWARGLARVLRRPESRSLRVGLIVQLLRGEGLRPDHYEEEVRSLISYLRGQPDLARWIVGVDVCGEELATPVRTIAGAYQLLRKELDGPHARWDPEHGGLEAPVRLGATVHVGEDFVDLLSGLRQIHEATQLLALRPLDRIGHASALFEYPREWYASRQSLRLDIGQRALDLLWAWRLLDRPDRPQDLAHASKRELVRVLKGAGVSSVQERLDNLRMLLDQEAERATDLAGRHHSESSSKAGMLSEASILDALGLGPAGNSHTGRSQVDDIRFEGPLSPGTPGVSGFGSVQIGDTNLQALIAEECRLIVYRSVVAANLVVELNPTSNLLISGRSRYADLPYLVRISKEPRMAEGQLMLSLSSDDPGLFHTHLRNEYLNVAHALAELGLEPDRVWETMSRLRRMAARSSFIPDSLPRGAALADLLEAPFE